MLEQKDKLSNIFLDLSNTIADGNRSRQLIEKILQQAAKIANADGCLFFDISADNFMSLSYAYIASLNPGFSQFEISKFFPPISLYEVHQKNLKQPAEICALTGEILISDNIYLNTNLDISFIANLDKELEYTTGSLLAIPLKNHQNTPIGIALFINALNANGKIISFTPEIRTIIQSICNFAIPILENKALKASYSNLLESFIEVLARAIDAKSPYTGSHCQKVPVIAKMLANAAIETTEGPLKNFELTADEWYSLHIASWLHDCGKVTTPDYIVDKATKLETVNNRIHEIRNRFEILRRDAHITYLQKRLAETDSKENLQAEFLTTVKSLEDDFSFIAHCNIGDYKLSTTDQKRLEQISKRKYTRYFNRMLGLSWNERNAIKETELYSHPAQESVLQNRPDHLSDLNNLGELYNLQITSGTINKEERKKINEHINATIDMLKALSFPKELANVIEYAGCHHEWVNGQGYPNQLTGEQMSIPAKIMAIADVFEALTAKDRPYKEPKKLSEVLQIMREMKNIGHLDPDLYEVFISQQVYMDYALQYLAPEQIDNINPEEFL